jgi:hypothetical protein
MANTVAQTLQKLHFTILGVPMDVQMQDTFVKKIEAEGWGWLNSIINDYLGFLANTSSHAAVVSMLAKNGWGLQLPEADLAFWGKYVKDGNITFEGLVTLAMQTVGGPGKDTMTQREQVAQRYALSTEAAKKAALDESPVAKAAINAILMGVNQTATSLEQANAALDQYFIEGIHSHAQSGNIISPSKFLVSMCRTCHRCL